MQSHSVRSALTLGLQMRHRQRKHRSILCPTGVELYEHAEHLCIALGIFLDGYEISPRLLIVAGRRPPRRLKQTPQDLSRHRLVRESARTPSFSYHVMKRYIGGSWFVHHLDPTELFIAELFIGGRALDERNLPHDAFTSPCPSADAARSVARLRRTLLHHFDIQRNRHIVADHQPSAVHLGIPFHAEVLPVDLCSRVHRGSLVAPWIFHRRCRSLYVQDGLFRYAMNGQVPGYSQLAGFHLLHLRRLESNRRILFHVEEVIATQILVSSLHARVH